MTQSLAERIRTAYADDQQNTSSPVDSCDIPTSYDTITDEWLTAALCGDVPGAQVVNHQLGEPDSGTSNRRRITIEYNDAGKDAGLAPTVFCKATYGLVNRLTSGRSGGVHCEVTFYQKVRELLDIEAPRAVYARYNPHSFNSLIILRDIGEQVEFCDHRTKVDRGRAESQLRLLARLHGSFYQSPALNRELSDLYTWPERFHRLASFQLEECCAAGVIGARDVIPDTVFSRRDEIWARTLESVDRHLHLPATLTHGDVHLKNWYVTNAGEMGLSDWQVTSKGHWSRDLAYTMSTALATPDRRVWERDLIAYYLDRLVAEGGERIELEDAMKLYRQQLFSALAFWTMTLTPNSEMPDMQPVDTTLVFISRIAAAIDDLDAFDSFS